MAYAQILILILFRRTAMQSCPMGFSLRQQEK